MLAVAAAACDGPPERPTPEEVEARLTGAAEDAWVRIAAALDARSDSIEDLLQPVQFLTPGEESGLRRHLGETHLAAARRLGVSPTADSAALADLEARGRLVALPDSTELWVIRDLDHSRALVTPDTRALLDELGRRFQARLETMGLPPLRLEVTSALRTADSQAELRDVNPNAATGVSAHQFGTTVDVAYSGFTAPAAPIVPVSAPDVPWLEPLLSRVAASAAERVAARKSRELQAVLGRVLAEMQDEGRVLVTLERRQPVYHLTVAEPSPGG